MDEGRLKRLVRRLIKAMAASRKEQIDGMEFSLLPAREHFYRQMLANLNGRTDEVKKWKKQEERVYLRQFVHELTRETKGKWDRRKAAAEAITASRSQSKAVQRGVTSMFQETYHLKTVTPLPSNADDRFDEKVQAIVDHFYPPKPPKGARPKTSFQNPHPVPGNLERRLSAATGNSKSNSTVLLQRIKDRPALDPPFSSTRGNKRSENPERWK